jgi:hypothetical protein
MAWFSSCGRPSQNERIATKHHRLGVYAAEKTLEVWGPGRSLVLLMAELPSGRLGRVGDAFVDGYRSFWKKNAGGTLSVHAEPVIGAGAVNLVKVAEAYPKTFGVVCRFPLGKIDMVTIHSLTESGKRFIVIGEATGKVHRLLQDGAVDLAVVDRINWEALRTGEIKPRNDIERDYEVFFPDRAEAFYPISDTVE